MARFKFEDIYSEEISMYQRKENVDYSHAVDKLWTEFVRVEFNEKIYTEDTLVKLLWDAI